MQIKNECPPNFKEIDKVIPHQEGNIYCYGDVIYNPLGGEIPEDIIYHEEVHSKQQGLRPDIWWTQYLNSEDFRLSQELEAYSRQYKFIKKVYNNKASKDILSELADNLTKLYNIDITKSQAETLIRKYEEKII